MTKAIVGIIGGSGVYDLPGLQITREKRFATPWGDPSDALQLRTHRGDRGGVPAPPWARPRAVAVRHQLSRQYRCDEARRRDRSRLGLGLRLVQARASAGAVRPRRPVRRSHVRAGLLVLRQRLRRACVDGPSHRTAAHRQDRRGRGRREHRRRQGRHLSLHGGAAILLLMPNCRPTGRSATMSSA